MSGDAPRDFSAGFVVERPRVVIPWLINEARLADIVDAAALRYVTRGYYTTYCEALAGLRIALGFHFEPRVNGKLREFEVFSPDPRMPDSTFPEFQEHLVRVLGSPTREAPSDSGFPHYEWRGRGYRVFHYVLDRFGPEEHVRFKYKS